MSRRRTHRMSGGRTRALVGPRRPADRLHRPVLPAAPRAPRRSSIRSVGRHARPMSTDPADPPRRQRAGGAGGNHRRARSPQSIGPGLARAAVAIRVDGQVRDLDRPDRGRRAASRSSPSKDPEALDVLRHSAAHVLATAVRELFPTRRHRVRSADRRRVLLRLRGAAALHAGGPGADRGADGRGDAKPTIRSCARWWTAPRPTSASRTIRSSWSGSASWATTRSSRSTPTVRSSICAAARTCPAPGGSSTSSCCTRRAPTGAATSGARCCSASTAPRCSRRKTSTRTCTGSRRRGSATTASWARSSTSSCSIRSRRAPSFWTERGTTIYNVLNDYLRELQRDGYQEIKTPLLYNKGLWEISGHWGKYRENMFLVLDNETGEHDFSLKPMNCPSHYLLYQSKKHSYRELPLRYSTYDVLHRNEVSRRAVRAHAGAAVPAGRLPHLPDGVADRGRGEAAHRLHPRLLPDLRAHRDAQVRHPAGGADRRRRDVGSRRRRRSGRRSRRPGCPTSSSRATAPSTGPRSTSTWPTRSAAPGSWAPSSSTTPRRSAST